MYNHHYMINFTSNYNAKINLNSPHCAIICEYFNKSLSKRLHNIYEKSYSTLLPVAIK